MQDVNIFVAPEWQLSKKQAHIVKTDIFNTHLDQKYIPIPSTLTIKIQMTDVINEKHTAIGVITWLNKMLHEELINMNIAKTLL